VSLTDINKRGIYTDLIRKFRDEGHLVTVVCPMERRHNKKTTFQSFEGVDILSVFTLNIQKTNIIEKGIGTLLIEYQFLAAIKKFLSNEKFDLVLYSTPPITFTKVISFVKTRDKAKTYLLLKDIFPQNAVDLGMIKKNSILHKYFLRKEKQLYAISDVVGCMSPANVRYILEHNPQLSKEKVEINPNSVELTKFNFPSGSRRSARLRFKIPENATACIYGGNLGRPQGIDFLLEVIESYKNREDIYFIIVGSGTEEKKIDVWFERNLPKNAVKLGNLPKLEYDELLSACDIGLVFLDRRFTIPNFPSRVLSYLELKIPIFAATDMNTDIGIIAEAEKFGFWSESGDLQTFRRKMEFMLKDSETRHQMGENGYQYMLANYLTLHSYKEIMKYLP
jgi:glycosyltransferase involved in cell wall biosynthesis